MDKSEAQMTPTPSLDSWGSSGKIEESLRELWQYDSTTSTVPAQARGLQ